MTTQPAADATFKVVCAACSGRTWTPLPLDFAIAWIRGHDQAHKDGII